MTFDWINHWKNDKGFNWILLYFENATIDFCIRFAILGLGFEIVINKNI